MRKFSYAALFALCLSAPIIPQMVSETTYYTSFAANFLFRNNLHEVVPSKLYRSAEMSREDLKDTISKYGIKTVVDLRLNADDADSTGTTEEQATAASGAKYVHIPLSSARADQGDKLLKLLDTFKSAETPVLVHCTSGTHRSGIASALWLLEQEHKPYDVAAEQFSARYGFFEVERKMKALMQGKPTLDILLRQFHADEVDGKATDIRSWLEQAAIAKPIPSPSAPQE
ncbi:MAG: tyrosine-protein phosphatase [Bdellovibrionota bacterium]